MSAQLLAIKFNHDPGSAHRDALNLRRNAMQFLPVPEWQPGLGGPEDSLAAYALEETQGNVLTIQARLRSPEDAGRSVEVRAVQPAAPELPPWWISAIVSLYFQNPWLYYALFQQLTTTWGALWGTANDILGEVKAKTVALNGSGDSGFETFELVKPHLWERGVGSFPMTWQWEIRRGPLQPWTKLALTSHKIYVVLRMPTAPWLQAPYLPGNTQLPWSEVLDHACRWAASTQTEVSAAMRVTDAVFGLGNGLLEYGCPIGAVTIYAQPFFNCTAFLDRLRGGYGRGPYLNCSDCATIVSTFANALGCDLWQSRMQSFGQSFPVNPIRAIGNEIWQPPCGIGLFSYHEVAWTGGCTEDDNVFDACLQVDSSPPFPPYTGVLPANMRFGGPGEGHYRDLLAAAWGRGLCEPQPTTRQRRFVF